MGNLYVIARALFARSNLLQSNEIASSEKAYSSQLHDIPLLQNFLQITVMHLIMNVYGFYHFAQGGLA